MEPEKPKTLTLPNRPNRSPKPSNIFPLKVVSNHLPISIIPQQKQTPLISIYSVSCEPEIPQDSRRKFRSIIKSAEKLLKEDIGEHILSGRNIFSLKKKDAVLTYPTKEQNEEYLVTVKLARVAEMQNLQNDTDENAKPVIQFVNIVIKQMMRNLKMIEIGRTLKFFYNDEKNIKYLDFKDNHLQVRNGFKTSLDIYKEGTKLLVDFCTRVLRTDSVLDVMKGMKGNQNQIKEYLIDASVLADYGNFRNYKIFDFDFKKTPKNTFPTSKGEVSFIDYYKDKYSVKIKDVNQPLIISLLKKRAPDGTKIEEKVYLIPELCKMTGLTDEQRADFNVMKELAYYTKLEPTDRMDRVSNHVDNLNKELKKNGWNMAIQELSTVNAYQIKVPELKFASEIIKPNDNGSFQLRSKILEPCTLDNWILMYSGRGQKDDDEVEEFYFNLQKAGNTFGIKVKEPVYVLISGIKGSDYVQGLKDNLTKKTQLVVAFIPKAGKNTVYKSFKKFCSQDRPVPSQVVVSASLYKNSLSVCSKVILQINAKLGYSLWLSQIPENFPKKVMIIGADVYHNVGAKKQSVIGLCASFDEKFSKYYSRIKLQNKVGKEIMENISNLIQDSIRKYFKMTKFLPETIIFYRDGVGEGQLQEVLKIEIPNILEGFKKINPDYNPDFCEVVVTKRINDRFFVPNGKPGNGGNKYYNPPSGTLVMDQVVSKNYDFFLCAQNVTQGTCTPTHYTVVYNKTNIPEDVLAKLTYYQCFNYYNWTGAIRVPACVQYASKMAYLVGQSLGADPGEELWDKLYFL